MAKIRAKYNKVLTEALARIEKFFEENPDVVLDDWNGNLLTNDLLCEIREITKDGVLVEDLDREKIIPFENLSTDELIDLADLIEIIEE